tara:strand:+ start:119 stop:256 length:138 start_codon:yes stop_codon:yes gene_type:complete
MFNIGRIFVGCFLIGFLWAGFNVDPILSGLTIGLLYGLTDYTRER